MDLTNLLNELSKNILRDRSQLVAGPNDQLWSNATLVEYINDAQTRFARQSLCLRDDFTPEYTQVQLEEGEKRYVLNAQVVSVVSGRYHEDLHDLARASHSMQGGMVRSDGWTNEGWSPSAVTSTPGRPQFYWTDEGVSIESKSRVILYLDREPTADEEGNIIYLRVCRLPCALSISNMKASSEIPEDYHLDMLDWAAYRALRNDDADGASEKAEKFKTAFERATMNLRREVLRKMHAEIGWAFGQNGFSWER